ncbi:4-hydroxybenzoate 3-monooxygenase [Achromobacter spanius]|uniref:4-hydroxybenzoate 3-monooxygenase n=1 Tax=Achromobacter spanius TaxID=217203 RepID=A0AA42LUP0_9BURK|nr:4-hydroxybenzoate 3-monooxygenase [Achromobacter spanius]MDH0739938.1 4-hydroxybenzoate 3-monooxygenase [Achromobacter spanius]
MRTQVAIIGAGPAGLMLSDLLYLQGIESVVLERRSRDAICATIRAGVLEQGTVDLMSDAGLGGRMRREGFRHEGTVLRVGGVDRRIDFVELTGGRAVMVYAQHEVIKDLVDARLASGGDLRFEVANVSLHDLASSRPFVRYSGYSGELQTVQADFIVGCDGTHGVSRAAIAPRALQTVEHRYPYGWLGMLCKAPPSSDELIYALGDDGFALVSTRSLQVQRMYLQCDPRDQPEDWSDDRIWSTLRARLATGDGWQPKEGVIFDKTVIGMRSSVTEPMRHGRLFLAGDAAHVVPPTGAKGLNLAMSDVRLLSRALIRFYRQHREDLLDAYSATALRRVWRAQRFSWWMTSLLHRAPGADAFERKLQDAELDYLTRSRAACTALAENYVGLPVGPLWD